jgi:hypothetical protein
MPDSLYRKTPHPAGAMPDVRYRASICSSFLMAPCNPLAGMTKKEVNAP